jgi:hypothetical protein
MSHSVRNALATVIGIAIGFASAVLFGWQASGYSKPSNFKRFHPYISPESYFYPTFAALENLALARWHPGRTLVVIGGNSVLNGVGQPEKDLWSLRLEKLLGTRYVVVNLSFRGASPAEGAALVAESLLRRGFPVVYVANTAPGGVSRSFDGTYRYLFWSARAEGKLQNWDVREKDLQFRLSVLSPADRARRAEEQLGARLDAALRFQSLWHHIAYRYGSTIWSFLLPRDSWRPRDVFNDSEQGPRPLAERFADNVDLEMGIVRSIGAVHTLPDGHGGWLADPVRLESVGTDIEQVFPPSLRPHILMLLSQNAPFYRNRLTPEGRRRDEAAFAGYERLWRKHGIACLTVGTDYQDADYRDRIHLGPSGGHKLAQQVADQVRRLAPQSP